MFQKRQILDLALRKGSNISHRREMLGPSNDQLSRKQPLKIKILNRSRFFISKMPEKHKKKPQNFKNVGIASNKPSATTKINSKVTAPEGIQPKKSIVHNVELPVTNKTVTFHQNQKAPPKPEFNLDNIATAKIRSHTSSSSNRKYHAPELNTLLKVTKQIKQLQTGRENGAAGAKIMTQIVSETDALRKERLTKQLNYPLQKKVFKNLIPINANDSIIASDAKLERVQKATLTLNKDAEPILADFLDPVPAHEFKDLRSRIKFPQETFKPPDLSSVTEQLQCIHEMTHIDY